MTQQALFPIAEANALIQGFTRCTLPKSEWTHEAHLMAGLFLLSEFGENAIHEMRGRLLRYNESVGGINDDHNGYHETLTVFWLWVIKKYMGDFSGTVRWDQENIDALLANEHLADRNLWKAYYSENTIKSVAARRGFVEPEMMP